MAVGSPNLDKAVEKAQERAAGLDLGQIAADVRDAKPEALHNPAQQRQRRAFLESLYDGGNEAEQAYERIIGGNELQGVNFLQRGAYVARTVLRIVIRNPAGRVLGYGSGFMIGDGVLITNNHVLGNSDTARASEAEAHYEYGLYGEEERVERFALLPDTLFYTSPELDFTIVAVAPAALGSGAKLAALGWLPLIAQSGKAMEGEWLTIIQHPKGERKQLCVRENQLIKCDTDVLWYSTDTLGGSSGSPVFNNDWLLVALHHSGVPEVKNGIWQTLDGRDYDPARDDETKINWIANEGIRISRIVETLRTDNRIATKEQVVKLLDDGVADMRMRLPVIYEEGGAPPGPAPAGLPPAPPAPAGGGDPPRERSSMEENMGRRLITVTLAVDDDGGVSIEGQSAAESSLLEAATGAKPKKNIIKAPVVPATDWVGGYDAAFLSEGPKPDPELAVHHPIVLQKEKIAPLQDAYGQTFTAAQKAAGILNYKGYSVVMNKERRFAFYSAANVDGGMRPMISGRQDNWKFDDRISRDHQIDDSYYKKNKFDRGHLTRRDDMEWGADPVDAVNRANGTCTWTNCAPQHEVFNQSKEKGVLLWQNLERYILEETAASNSFRAQVFTGPIFGAADPEFRKIAYPLEFWKVVAAIDDDGNLFATGYVLGQKETIDKHGLEAAVDIPFGAFGTYQRLISEIENLTGLQFTYGSKKKSLSDVDPLAKPTWRRGRAARSAAGAQESFSAGGADDALDDLDEIVLY